MEVRIEHAEYWDVKQVKIVQLFKMATASVTGERPNLFGEKGSVRMA